MSAITAVSGDDWPSPTMDIQKLWCWTLLNPAWGEGPKGKTALGTPLLPLSETAARTIVLTARNLPVTEKLHPDGLNKLTVRTR